MTYFGDGGTIHGTTQWAAGPVQAGHWSHQNTCPDCGRSIVNEATRCKRHRRQREETRKENRARFAAYAATLSQEDVEALTARQMVRVRQKLGEWKELGDG